MRMKVCVFLLVGAMAACIPAQAQRTLVRAGHVLDVKTGKVADNQTIVVKGDAIVSIAPTSEVAAQQGDTVVDLGGLTVLPGLIDVHTHLSMNTDFDPYREVVGTEAKEAINGVVHAQETLMAGFTSARNVGASGYVDVDLRDAINSGQVLACRPAIIVHFEDIYQLCQSPCVLFFPLVNS